MSGYDAYWIDPHGRSMGIPYRHINHIIANPAKYGLTDKYVKGLFKKYNERPGQEGNAREEIMLELMKKGWIRVRKVVSGSVTWTIQTWGMSSTAVKHILGWVLDMAKAGDISKNTQLNIMDAKTGHVTSSSVGKAVTSLGESVKKRNALLERNEKGKKLNVPGKNIPSLGNEYTYVVMPNGMPDAGSVYAFSPNKGETFQAVVKVKTIGRGDMEEYESFWGWRSAHKQLGRLELLLKRKTIKPI